jgi:hypothetical protein
VYGLAQSIRNSPRRRSREREGRTPKCPCELDCYGGAGRAIRIVYRPACRRMVHASRTSKYLLASFGVLAFGAGWFLGRFTILHWMLLSLPLIVLSWVTLLSRSKILTAHAAAILYLLQIPTLGTLMGLSPWFNLYGVGAANLLLWAAVPLWLAPKGSEVLVCAGAMLFGLAAGWAAPPFRVELPGAIAVCCFTFYAARKSPSMPYGLFHPGYLTTL